MLPEIKRLEPFIMDDALAGTYIPRPQGLQLGQAAWLGP